MTCASTASTFTLSLNHFFSHSYQLLARNPFLFTTICVAGGGPVSAPPSFFRRFSILLFSSAYKPIFPQPLSFLIFPKHQGVAPLGLDFQTFRPSDFRLSDLQTFRLSDFQTFRLSDFQTFRLSDFQTFRPSPLRPATLSSSTTCRLFALSLQHFHPSFPFFSATYSLFFAHTGGAPSQ